MINVWSTLVYTMMPNGLAAEVARIAKQDLLILDDFNLQSFHNDVRSILMEIIEYRRCKKSTTFTSQALVSHWHGLIGEKTVEATIMDSIVHDVHGMDHAIEPLRRMQSR